MLKNKKSEQKKDPKLPSYKNKSKMPSSSQERASRYFELRDENEELKVKLKDYESDLKKMATKLVKLQELIGEGSGRGDSCERPAMDSDELTTIAQENKRLKDLVRNKEEELRKIHTVKAHSQRPKTAVGAASKTKIEGDVYFSLNTLRQRIK